MLSLGVGSLEYECLFNRALAVATFHSFIGSRVADYLLEWCNNK